MSKRVKQKKTNKTSVTDEKPSGHVNWLWPMILFSITWVCFSGSLDNQLLTWDDRYYITENEGIRQIDLQKIFSLKGEGFVMGNYHPLTMLSYSVNYHFSGLDASAYIATNIWLHIFNTLLVYLFVMLLVKQRAVAFITAILFAIHPMHVESVVWASQRKDVLYTFFYLSGLCTYLQYLRAEKGKLIRYFFTLALFLLSLFSKGMAVSFPIVLLLIGYFENRKLSWALALEKLPFFALSVVFGLIAVKAQGAADAIGSYETYTLMERLFLAPYALTIYLYKAIAPLELSCFYSYPERTAGGALPLFVYLMPLLIGGIAFCVYWFARKNRDIIFSAGFFLATIALVLQVLPVGGAIVAERYTYLPYIGLFFLFSRWVTRYFQDDSTRFVAAGSTAAVVLALLFISINRTKVWKNTVTLWTDAIEKDNRSPIAFNGRGDAYLMEKKINLAIEDFNRALALQEKYPEAYYNRGLAYYNVGMYEKAINDYTKAIEYKPTLAVAYYNRSGTYYTLQQFGPALTDALKAQELGYKVDSRYLEVLEAELKKTSEGR